MEIREYKEFQKDEIIPLYEAVGWKAYTQDIPALKEGFENSLSVLAAYENDELLGLIRAVGDGATIIYIQDLLVYPQYQRKGIGKALLSRMLERYRPVRQIILVSDDDPAVRTFYKSMGFEELGELGLCGYLKK